MDDISANDVEFRQDTRGSTSSGILVRAPFRAVQELKHRRIKGQAVLLMVCTHLGHLHGERIHHGPAHIGGDELAPQHRLEHEDVNR